jgi:putative serine protease XkdF
MCCSCGCGRFSDDHGDSRHITLGDLQSAAAAADMKLSKVAGNIDDAVDAQASKSTSERFSSGAIIKSNDEQRYVLMVSYPVLKADVSVAQDGHRDFGQAPVIEQACFNFMRKGCKLGMWHKEGYNPGEVVENYIYRGPDWIVKGEDGSTQEIIAGDWLTGMILTPEVWQLYKAGVIGGASPQGRAKRRVPSPDTLAQLRS